jgi:uncharacterized protein YbjT (DUF2867 family)
VRVLLLGASGFIGAYVASALAQAGWSVRAGARNLKDATLRAPQLEWVKADFRELTTPGAWAPLLEGVDAVVNCVGVLQDGVGGDTRLAHVDGPTALIAACEAAGVKRFVHISAVGAEAGSGAAYGRTKGEAERRIEASSLDWVILRPSLVIARSAHGGTALMRALAALPGLVPVVSSAKPFRPVAMGDVAAAVARLVEPEAPKRVRLDLAGPREMALADLLKLFRAWLGFGPARFVVLPRPLAALTMRLGDLAGWLGWPSPLRTTSLRQMEYDVGGEPAAWTAATGLSATDVGQYLASQPAWTADRWHARLYFVRPIAIAALTVMWTLTGLIAFGPGWTDEVELLRRGGLTWKPEWVVGVGAVFDIAMGLALLVRAWTARIAVLMALSTVGYLIGATILAPQLWLDPLGPWLKVIPMMALCLFVAATEARR